MWSARSTRRFYAWRTGPQKKPRSNCPHEESVISLSETELNLRDESDTEIYIDISLDRPTLDDLIAPKVMESIEATREALEKAHQSPTTIERIVFVGGPTQYGNLRNKVAFELGIEASTEVNPMTAVAEGAAIFAESIDWSSHNRIGKTNRGAVNASGKLELSFNFTARTPSTRARVAVKLGSTPLAGTEFQIESLDTGWSSGRLPLTNGATVDLILGKAGENTFKTFVFDPMGGVMNLENNKFVITQTAATIDAIPASSSIGIEVTGRGSNALDYLVREGDPLPCKGSKTFLAGESLRAGATTGLHFILREGEITDPVQDNACIGELEITGSDFDDGVIAQGAELICDYEVLDSGQIILSVSVPSIGGTFGSGQNFYSRKVAGRDFSNDAPFILQSATDLRERVDHVSDKVDDPKLRQASAKLDAAQALDPREHDPETAKQAMEDVQMAKKLLADVRFKHLKTIRQLELDLCLAYFEGTVRKNARPTEEKAYDTLTRTTQRSIDHDQPDFEYLVRQMRFKNFDIMFRQDWYVIDLFKRKAATPYRYLDQARHAELSMQGDKAIQADDIQKLRNVVLHMYAIVLPDGDDLDSSANITASGR